MNNIVEQGYRAAMKAVIDESLWTGQLDDPGIRQAPIELALSFVRSTSAKADLLSSGIRWVPKRTGHWNDCVQRFGNGNYWPGVRVHTFRRKAAVDDSNGGFVARSTRWPYLPGSDTCRSTRADARTAASGLPADPWAFNEIS
jgi:hypothetical protein